MPLQWKMLTWSKAVVTRSSQHAAPHEIIKKESAYIRLDHAACPAHHGHRAVEGELKVPLILVPIVAIAAPVAMLSAFHIRQCPQVLRLTLLIWKASSWRKQKRPWGSMWLSQGPALIKRPQGN